MKNLRGDVLILALVIISTAHNAIGGRPTYSVSSTEVPIVVDGAVDEPGWRGATTIPLSYEYQPGDNIVPVVATEALITFDKKNLYVAFRAEDPDPSQIRAHLMDRDQIATFIQDDHVVLMIDPFNDERRGFQFRVNPLGVQADAIFSETDGIEDFSWDLIWDSAGRITELGYVIEIAISLNQIRFPRTAAVQTWGFDLTRSYPRKVRRRFSAVPKDRSSSCVLCQVAKVTGFSGLEPGRNLEIDPTVTATRTDLRQSPPGGGLQEGDIESEIGVNGAWGITPNITVSATLNPDFSQVEADAAQLEVNERFALLYTEKRPFFLEGIDFFATPVQAVFTRTVADPSWGAKVTGKEGRHAMGLFVTSDEVNNLLIPSNQGTAFTQLDDTVRSTVLRHRVDVGRGSTLGVVYTGRQGDDYHNRVGGIDGFFRLSQSNTVRFQYLSSNTQYPLATAEAFDQPRDAFTGDAAQATFQHSSRSWFAQVNYEDYDPGFRADNGFVPRVDVRTFSGFGQHILWGEEGDWYTQVNVGTFISQSHDHYGELCDEIYQVFGNVGGPWQSRVGFNVNRIGELYGGVYYSGLDRYGANVELQPSGSVRLALDTLFGDTIDYVNNQPADLAQISPSVELKLGRNVNAKIDHSTRKLDVAGGTLFKANLTQLTLLYHFDVKTLIRGSFQYFDITSDPSLYTISNRPEPEEQRLYTELLFSYKLNPQTVIFVGCSDNRRGLQAVSLTETDRTFFIKLGYAWAL